MRGWLRPLVPLYRAGLVVKGWMSREPKRLQERVISVGSLSAGGAGKTPVVMMVVKMLRDEEFGVDVLSRGYGRSGRGVERVEAAGETDRFGDEPMLMAQRLDVPIWVGADRYAAGLAAEKLSSDVVHVLDDGFQHRRLGRDVDVVLLTRAEVNDVLLPAGNLREEIGALRRADVVVLREEEAAALSAFVPKRKIVWLVRRTVTFAEAHPQRMMVFCGIARPEGFLQMLEEHRIVPAGTMLFKDHYRYETRDVAMLAEMARLSRAEGFCTTEKDMVKLTREMRTVLEGFAPVFVAQLDVVLVKGSLQDLFGRQR